MSLPALSKSQVDLNFKKWRVYLMIQISTTVNLCVIQLYDCFTVWVKSRNQRNSDGPLQNKQIRRCWRPDVGFEENRNRSSSLLENTRLNFSSIWIWTTDKRHRQSQSQRKKFRQLNKNLEEFAISGKKFGFLKGV